MNLGYDHKPCSKRMHDVRGHFNPSIPPAVRSRRQFVKYSHVPSVRRRQNETLHQTSTYRTTLNQSNAYRRTRSGAITGALRSAEAPPTLRIPKSHVFVISNIYSF
jgi:hypothetical protein